MRNKTMRRSLAWLLTAATALGSVPVSAEELITEQSVDLEAEEQEEADQADYLEDSNEDSDTEEDVTLEYADDSADENAVVIDGTSDTAQNEVPSEETQQESGQQAMEEPYSYVYTGQEIAVQTEEGATVTGGTESAVNVGEYTVEIVDAEGVAQEITWKITPAELTATCYYAEVKEEAEETAEESAEASEKNANIEVAVEVIGFVNGENEETAAGYVAPQYTQPVTLEDAATMKAFGGEADNYTFVYADSVDAGEAEGEIATQAGTKMLASAYLNANGGVTTVILNVMSFNQTISSQLEGNCTLSVEEVTSGEEYEAVKLKLNEVNDNRVQKYGYLKLTAKDADGNVIDLNDSMTYMTSIQYSGAMQNVTNVPTAIYGVNKDDTGYTLIDGSFGESEDEGKPAYMEGNIDFAGVLGKAKSADRIAIVAEEDMIAECPLPAGTYTVTANLTVLGENNEVLPGGVQVYLGNPNFPPITALHYNAKLVVDENKKMTVTIENFSEIFQVISMTDGSDIHIKEIGYTKSETDSVKEQIGYLKELQFRHEERINKLVLELDNGNGLYQFGECQQSPIILDHDYNMKMHLQVDFSEYIKGFDETKGDVKEYSFADEATGVQLQVRTTDTGMEEKLENASFSVKENTSGNYQQMVESMYYDGTTAYKIYDIALKDKNGKEIDLSNTGNVEANTETKITAATKYKENRMWKLDGLNIEKLKGVTTKGDSAVYTSLETGLGTFAIVDNTSATQYAAVRTVKDGMAVTCYQKQGDTVEGFSITEDTQMDKIFVSIDGKKTDTAYGTVYNISAVNTTQGWALDMPDSSTRKLELYVPYDASKAYYFVSDDGEGLQAEPMQMSNANDKYVAFNIAEYITKDKNRNYGLKNAYDNKAADKNTLNCYILATDKNNRIASTPMSNKEVNYKMEMTAVTYTYSGVPQKLWNGGSDYVVTSGVLENKNAGDYAVEVKPEEGYTWADGTTAARTLTATIQKHNLSVRVKSEAVLVGQTPKYELEYGYFSMNSSIRNDDYYFVGDDNEENLAGYISPTITKVDTSKPGDYEVTLTGGSSDNYNIIVNKNGNINNKGIIHVLESAEKIVSIPKIEVSSVYTAKKASEVSVTYIVPKDETEIQKISILETPDENAGYTVRSSGNYNLGITQEIAKLKPGYVWEDGSTLDKYYNMQIYQIVDKPVIKETVEYNGSEQSPFDQETLEQTKIGAANGKLYFPENLSKDPVVKNDQYKATEVGEYQVLLALGNHYCWDESGNRESITYNWSIIPAEEKKVDSTETITANLALKGSDASAAGLSVLEALAGADGYAYLTNPNAPLANSNEDNDPNWKQIPPTAAVNDNATLITYTDGTMALKVPVKNAVFTLQELGSSEQIAAEDVTITRKNGTYGTNTSRIDSITIPVTAKTGSIRFHGCVVYPTLLMTGYTVPLTLTYGTAAVQEKTSISNAVVSGITDAVYTGSAITQSGLKVTMGNGLVTLKEGTDYKVTYSNNVNPGTATITITGIGSYKDSITKTFTIAEAKKDDTQKKDNTAGKAKQSINVKTGAKGYKYTSLQKKKASFTIGATASGKLTYKVTSAPKNGKKYVTVDKNGKVTLKKKTPAGVYQITVFAAGTSTQEAATSVVTVTVNKKAQKVTAKNASKTIKAKKVAKKNQSFTIGAKGKGKLTYKVISTPQNAGKYISVNKKGKVTIKKNAPKGTYKIQVTAAGNATYEKATKTVTVKVK